MVEQDSTDPAYPAAPPSAIVDAFNATRHTKPVRSLNILLWHHSHKGVTVCLDSTKQNGRSAYPWERSEKRNQDDEEDQSSNDFSLWATTLILTEEELKCVDIAATAEFLLVYQHRLDPFLVGSCLVRGMLDNTESGSFLSSLPTKTTTINGLLQDVMKRITQVYISRHEFAGLHLDDAAIGFFRGLDYCRLGIIGSRNCLLIIDMFAEEYSRQNSTGERGAEAEEEEDPDFDTEHIQLQSPPCLLLPAPRLSATSTSQFCMEMLYLSTPSTYFGAQLLRIKRSFVKNARLRFGKHIDDRIWCRYFDRHVFESSENRVFPRRRQRVSREQNTECRGNRMAFLCRRGTVRLPAAVSEGDHPVKKSLTPFRRNTSLRL